MKDCAVWTQGSKKWGLVKWLGVAALLLCGAVSNAATPMVITVNPSPAQPGEQVIVEVAVSNDGAGPVQNIQVTMDYPVGMDSLSEPSRFIAEIPDEFVEEIRPRVHVSRPLRRPKRAHNGFVSDDAGVQLGQRVRHAKFGDGVVLNCMGQGAHTQVEVNFETVGTKILVLAYANLDLM